MGIETYLAQIRAGGADADLSLVNVLGWSWRGLLKPHIYSKRIKTGVACDEVRRLIMAWPMQETVGSGREIHPLDMSMGPFWRTGTSTPMAWANIDFDAPCRACAASGEEATCSHKEPLDAVVELAYADAFRFHKLLEQSGLEVSRFVDGRFEAGDYTLVLSGRRGVGILLARLLAPQPYRGLRGLLEEWGEEWPTLDKAALRAKPGPVRMPLSQHPGERYGPRAGLRLPLDPGLIGPLLSPEDARLLQESSLALARAARDEELEKVSHLPEIFADVMLPQKCASGAWDAFVAELESRAPEQTSVYGGSSGVPADIRRACRDLGWYRGDARYTVLVWCPCCGAPKAWLTRDKTLWCFRKKCPASESDGGLAFDKWHRQSSRPPARIIRVFAQSGASTGATEHAVGALGDLTANGLPFAPDHVRPRNETAQGGVAFFDPWLAAYYGPFLPETAHAREFQADAEGVLNSIGSGRIPLEELSAGARSERASDDVPPFEFYEYERWREIASMLEAEGQVHLEFDSNEEFVWLSLSGEVRLVTESRILCNQLIHEALGQLEALSISTTDDIRRLLGDRVPYPTLRRLPIRTLELPVRLLNNRRRRLPVPFSRWRLVRKLWPERVSPLRIAELLYEAVEDHGLTETCRLENAIAVDVAGLERSGPCVDIERSDAAHGHLREEIEDVEGPLQRFIGPCANIHDSGDIKARFAEEGVILEDLRESTLERAADEATGATARWLEAYGLWKQKIARANDLKLLDDGLSDDGRVQPTVDQLGTCTGRFSWTSPPLASISKETREYLMAAPGRRFVSLDISQAQLRIAAELSGDPALLQVFEAQEDVHNSIASQLFGEEPDESQRSQAKAVSFGVLLGMGAETLVDYAVDFGAELSEKEAVELIDRFVDQFSDVRSYRQALFREMLIRSVVEAPSGRRCNLNPSDDSLHPGTTLAYILQMTEADIIKSALLRICDQLDLDRARPSIVLHDELIVEAEEGYVEETSAILTEALSDSLAEHLRQCPVGSLTPRVSRCWGDSSA